MIRVGGNIWIRRGGEGILGGGLSVNRCREAGSVARKRPGWCVMGKSTGRSWKNLKSQWARSGDEGLSG